MESFKDIGEVSGGNTDAVILNGNHGLWNVIYLLLRNLYQNVIALRAIFDRVREEIGENTFKVCGIPLSNERCDVGMEQKLVTPARLLLGGDDLL